MREIYRKACYWPLRLLYCNSTGFRSYYWEFRAPDVHAQWGCTTTNYDNLTAVITKLGAKRILDFGCGSGRLLPLYAELAISEIVGHDVSQKALEICRARCPSDNLALFSGEMSALPFPPQYFDLVICNRVLQHIPPGKIERTLAQIARYAKSFYVCEMSQADFTSRFFFMFLHDYEQILGRLGFQLVSRGGSDANQWIVCSRLSPEEPSVALDPASVIVAKAV